VFSEAERNLLVSLIGLMDDEEIAEVYEIFADPLYSERLVDKFNVIATVIHCNDRTVDLYRTYETLRAVEAPQLITTEAILYNFGVVCAGYGLSGTPSEPIVNSSEFPVLVSNGALDVSTPVIWGEQVYENLENARMVTFPNSGHGATRETNCARDITNAFFMNPEAEFNDDCIENLRPVFVLPGDPLLAE
jgi:pimeloyl-ACP methyl ester carboxylesterase